MLGKEKSGKSFFSQQQALCVAAGVPFLGQPTTKGRVLLIEEEGSKRMMKDRIQRQAEALEIDTRDLDLWPIVRERLRLETEEDQNYLRSVIEDYQPQVVIMGPLSQLFSLDDENAAGDMNKVTRFMQDTAAKTDSVIQLAHHMNKNVNVSGGRSQFFNGARGSSALMGAVDASVGLGRQEGQETGRIHLLLRDDEGWSFKVRWDGDRVLFVRDGSAEVVDGESTVSESVPHGEDATCLSLLTYLAENPWQSCGVISKGEGMPSKNTVRSHLDEMVPDHVQRDTSTRSDLYAVVGEASQPPTV